MESTIPDVNEGLDWALDFTLEKRPDRFIWDTGGLGLSLKRQVSDSLSGTKTDYLPFNGASGPQRPEEYYQDSDKDDYTKKRKNKDYFKNLRAHCYGLLRDRFYNTYLAVEKGQYRDPDDLISLSSEIKHIAKLRAELCRIPKKNNGSGLFQIMDKAEMKTKYKIESPNIGDSVMMSELFHDVEEEHQYDEEEYNYGSNGWMA
jgi:phage terminase large subunit